MTAMPKLPQPLTPDSLRGLMTRRAYWDANDPRFPAYQRLVRRGFEILYPGPVRRDDTCNMIDTPPLPSEQVFHLVAQANRELDAADPLPENQKGGTVHVQAHTRDGGETEVSDYWRNAPGHGAGDGAQEARNHSRGKTGEGGGTQAGTDDHRTKYDDPFSRLPRIEVRDDGAGDGRFAASRKDQYGNKHEHGCVDILAPPGTTMTSPADGTIEVRDSYKDDRFDNRYKNVWVKTGNGTEIGLFYVTPHDSNGNTVVKTGDQVRAGDPVGTVQDRAAADRSGKMKNHVHIEIRDKSQKVIDPTSHIEAWQRRR